VAATGSVLLQAPEPIELAAMTSREKGTTDDAKE
jgi:hypothetical protein